MSSDPEGPFGRKKVTVPIFSLPFLGESVSSYLIRLTALNRYTSLHWIPHALGIIGFGFRARQVARLAQRMEEMWGCGDGSIAATSFGHDMAHRNSMILPDGQPIILRHIHIGPIRFCPDCLREFGCFLLAWEIRLVTACPRHKLYLLSSCQACGLDLQRSRASLLRCPGCGFPFQDSKAPIASAAATLFSELLFSRLPAPFSCRPDGAVPAPWRILSLAELIVATSFLDRFHPSRDPCDPNRLKVDAALIEQNVVPIIIGWPASFHDFLTEICKRRRSEGRANTDGIQHALGGAYLALAFERSGHLKFMFEELARFAEVSPNQRLVTARGGSKIYGPAKICFLTKAETCKVLGIGRDTFTELVRKGHLHSQPVQFGKQHAHRVSIFEVGALQRLVRRSLPVAEAARTLRLTRRQMQRELREGRLEAVLGMCHAGPLARRVSWRSIKSYIASKEAGQPFMTWLRDD